MFRIETDSLQYDLDALRVFRNDLIVIRLVLRQGTTDKCLYLQNKSVEQAPDTEYSSASEGGSTVTGGLVRGTNAVFGDFTPCKGFTNLV